MSSGRIGLILVSWSSSSGSSILATHWLISASISSSSIIGYSGAFPLSILDIDCFVTDHSVIACFDCTQSSQ